MARTDRDQEISIYFATMSALDAAQYEIMPNPMPGYYGQPYDLGSIMHYYPTVRESVSFLGERWFTSSSLLERDDGQGQSPIISDGSTDFSLISG